MRILTTFIMVLMFAGPVQAWQLVGSGVVSSGSLITRTFDFTAESVTDPWTNANWTIIPKTDINDTVRIVVGSGGNALRPSSEDDLILYWDTDTFGNKQYSSVKVDDIATVNDYSGPAVRVQSGYSCYFLSIRDASRLRVYKVVSGTYTQLGSDISTAVATNDVVTLKVDGYVLSAFINGSQVGSNITDAGSTFASGNVGMLWDYIASSYESWEGGEW